MSTRLRCGDFFSFQKKCPRLHVSDMKSPLSMRSCRSDDGKFPTCKGVSRLHPYGKLFRAVLHCL